MIRSKTLEDVDNRLSRMEAHMFQLTDLLQKNVETEHRFGKQASSFSPPADINEQPGKPETFLPPALITDANGRMHFVGVNSILQMITEAESNVKSKVFPLLSTSSNGKSRPIVVGVEDRDKSQLLADDTFETTETNMPRIPVQEDEAIRFCKRLFSFHPAPACRLTSQYILTTQTSFSHCSTKKISLRSFRKPTRSLRYCEIRLGLYVIACF
jgi:hypothetical protein